MKMCIQLRMAPPSCNLSAPHPFGNAELQRESVKKAARGCIFSPGSTPFQKFSMEPKLSVHF
jgi:hypothetical protein